MSKVESIYEVWRPFPKPDHTTFEVSDLGRVRHVRHKKARRYAHGGRDRDGDLSTIRTTNNTYMIHTLVYKTFKGAIGPDEKVVHIDNDRGNNALLNLRKVKRGRRE